MPRLIEHTPFVKEQMGVQAKMIEKFSDETWRVDLHQKNLQQLENLADSLIEADLYIKKLESKVEELESEVVRPNGVHKPKYNQLNLSFDDIKDLPEELLNELSISDSDKVEYIIQGIINKNGGIASLDIILVGLYHETKEIYKRTALTSRLYKMGQKEMAFNVPNKKGVYSTKELSEESLIEELL